MPAALCTAGRAVVPDKTAVLQWYFLVVYRGSLEDNRPVSVRAALVLLGTLFIGVSSHASFITQEKVLSSYFLLSFLSSLSSLSLISLIK